MGTAEGKAGRAAEEPREKIVDACKGREQIVHVELGAPVVGRSLLGIAEHLVRLGDLPKALLRGGVVGIGVWVTVPGELAESPLDLVLGRASVDTEDVVVVGHVRNR